MFDNFTLVPDFTYDRIRFSAFFGNPRDFFSFLIISCYVAELLITGTIRWIINYNVDPKQIGKAFLNTPLFIFCSIYILGIIPVLLYFLSGTQKLSVNAPARAHYAQVLIHGGLLLFRVIIADFATGYTVYSSIFNKNFDALWRKQLNLPQIICISIKWFFWVVTVLVFTYDLVSVIFKHPAYLWVNSMHFDAQPPENNTPENDV